MSVVITLTIVVLILLWPSRVLTPNCFAINQNALSPVKIMKNTCIIDLGVISNQLAQYICMLAGQQQGANCECTLFPWQPSVKKINEAGWFVCKTPVKITTAEVIQTSIFQTCKQKCTWPT